jgi:hypothetical protein
MDVGTIKHIQLAAVKYSREFIAKVKRKERSVNETASASSTSFVTTTGRYEDILKKSSKEIEVLQNEGCRPLHI